MSLIVEEAVFTVCKNTMCNTPNRKGRISGITLLITLLVLCGATLQTAVAAGDASTEQVSTNQISTEQVYSLDITAQKLPHALEALADQTGALMIIPFDLAASRDANSVVGRYTLVEALDQLLDNTGLSGDLFQKRIIIISLLEKNVMPAKKTGVATGVLASMLAANTALSQEQPQRSSFLEEIIVTAQKREQKAQDVGIAISAFDQESLDRAGIADVTRLDLVTPGLSFAQRGNDFKVTIRGANAENTFRDVSPPIGMFVDGVYKPTAAQAGGAFLDVQRVEVLKGPQGTLFGRNTLGGAINIITNKPDTESFDYGLDLTLGNYAHAKPEFYINAPVSDDFAVRLAGMYQVRDGYVKNHGPGKDLAEVDRGSIRLSALWNVNDSFDLLATLFYYDVGGTSLSSFGYQSLGTLRNSSGVTDNNGTRDPINPRYGSLGARTDRGPWDVYRDGDYDLDNQETVFTLEANWDLGAVAIKSISSYTDYEQFSSADSDFSENLFAQEQYEETLESFTQEIQLISNDPDSDFEWVLGAIFSDEEYNQTFMRIPVFGEIANDGTPLPAGGRCLVQSFATAADPTAPVPCPSFTGNGQPTVESIGVFGQLTYHVSDSLRLIAGARWNQDDKSLDRDIWQNAGLPDESNTFEKVTWRTGVEWNVLEDSMIYGSVSTGFLSGGHNFNRTFFDQQEVTAYEIGMKNRFADDRVQLNMSAYYNDFTNLLASAIVIDPVTGSVQIFVRNGGEIEARGFEAELTAIPVDGLTVGATLAWQDSEYGEFSVVNSFVEGSNTPAALGNTIQLRGKQTPWAPDWAGSFFVAYDFNTSFGTVTPMIQLAYSGDHQVSGLQQHILTEQDAYTKTDLRLRWQPKDPSWSVEAYVENVTEEEVLHHTIIGGNDTIQAMWSTPRFYGLKIKYRPGN